VAVADKPDDLFEFSSGGVFWCAYLVLDFGGAPLGREGLFLQIVKLLVVSLLKPKLAGKIKQEIAVRESLARYSLLELH